MQENGFKSFKRNLLLFLLPLLVPLLTLGIFSQVTTKQYIEKELNKNNINILKQTKENLELIFNELDSLNLNFSTNSEITVKLKKILNQTRQTLNYEEFQTLNTLKNFIAAPANARPYIYSIYVYLDNDLNRFLTSNNGVVSLNDFYDKSWFESYSKRDKYTFFWTEPRTVKHYHFEKTGTEILTIYRSLFVSGHLGSSGVIVLNIYTDYLKKHLNNLVTYPDQRILIANDKNSIIFSNLPMDFLTPGELSALLHLSQPVSVFRSSHGTFITSQLVSEKYKWKYISTIPYHTFYQIPKELQILTIVLSILSFLLGLALTYWLTKKNYNQLQNIVSVIKSTENGLALPEPPSQIRDEYGFITYNIVKTFIEQNYLKVQLSARKYQLHFMELLALQSQINPHFLFNTLETIKWKTIQFTKKPNEASKMLEELAQILKYSLESPGKKVPLREEIANTRSYIQIQKIRYQDKFDAIWEYDEPVLNFPVIRLIIQPLIENAIYHGIKPAEKKCLIKIKIYQNDRILKISVIDDGLGISREKLAAIRAKLKHDGEYTQHVGLYNTNKRLKLVYGDEFGLKIRGKEGLGTAVYLRIPLETESNDQSQTKSLVESAAEPGFIENGQRK